MTGKRKQSRFKSNKTNFFFNQNHNLLHETECKFISQSPS